LVGILNYLLKSSCAKLLAVKFSLKRQAKVFKKFGAQLSYVHVNDKGVEKRYDFYKPSYKATLKFMGNASPIVSSLYGNLSLASLDGLTCSVCQSDYRVEMHHVRHLKDLNPKLSLVDKLMAKRKRKQIALCRSCHMVRHRVGPSLRGIHTVSSIIPSNVRYYHYYSLKRKGKKLVLYSPKPLNITVYEETHPKHNTLSLISEILLIIIIGILVIGYLLCMTPEMEHDIVNNTDFIPSDICINNIEIGEKEKIVTIVHSYSSDTGISDIIEPTLEDMLINNMSKNLANYIENGRISILTSDDNSSLCTEIVNRIQNGDNVTIVSCSQSSDNSSIANSKVSTVDLEIDRKSVDTSNPGLVE